MSEGEVTKWLTSHGGASTLTVELAKQLARESRVGWYIVPHSHDRFSVGKLTLEKLASRHTITDDEGAPLTFTSVEEAKAFLKNQLGILVPQVFDI